jgi:hypothetical protein
VYSHLHRQHRLPDLGIVASLPPSLPILSRPFLIFSASSIPPITIAAVANFFN